MGKKRRAQADLRSKAFYGRDGEPKSYRQELDEQKIANYLSSTRRKAFGDAEENELDDSVTRERSYAEEDGNTNDEVEDDGEDDELAMEMAALQQSKGPRREHKNDVMGMEQALLSFRQLGPTGKKLGFVERLTFTGPKMAQELVPDVHDDLQREATFYDHCLSGVKESFARLDELGMKYTRPHDYYAEMIKTDGHMEKVKSKLLGEKDRLDEREEKRKQRDNKKLAKRVEAERTQAKAKKKKSDLEAIKQWRKG
eukprot:SAG31_NODE_1396_length_8511_cov_1.939491_1_plen_254_part_10